jgi:hypothetical protein
VCDLLPAAGPQTADVELLPEVRVAIDRHRSIGVNCVDGERTCSSRFEFVRFVGSKQDVVAWLAVRHVKCVCDWHA